MRNSYNNLSGELFEQKPCSEWMEILVGASIPCGPVNDMASLFADPQVLHRQMVADVPHPTLGSLRLTGVPIKYEATPGQVRLPPPLLGQHTEEILDSVLGYPPERVAELREAGVVQGAS